MNRNRDFSGRNDNHGLDPVPTQQQLENFANLLLTTGIQYGINPPEGLLTPPTPYTGVFPPPPSGSRDKLPAPGNGTAVLYIVPDPRMMDLLQNFIHHRQIEAVPPNPTFNHVPVNQFIAPNASESPQNRMEGITGKKPPVEDVNILDEGLIQRMKIQFMDFKVKPRLLSHPAAKLIKPPSMMNPRRMTEELRGRFKGNGSCAFCKTNGESEMVYKGHSLKDDQNRVTCPLLRVYRCPVCGYPGGDAAHTIRYCPKRREEHLTN